MAKRVVGCVLAASAAVALVPGTVLADQPFSGTAVTATLTVSIDPNALLSVPTSAIPSQVSSLLDSKLPMLSVQVNGAHASATRSGAAADFSTGHADVTPISLQVSSLDTMLSNLQSALETLWGDAGLPDLPGTESQLQTLLADSAVTAALPAALVTQLTTLQGDLQSLSQQVAQLPAALSSATTTLQGRIADATSGLHADLNSAHPDGQDSASAALTVPPQQSPLPSSPEVAQVTPFSATAVNAAGAKQLLSGNAGAQASANEATASIAIKPVLDMTGLGNDLVTLQSTLQQVQSLIGTVQPQLASVESIITLALPSGLNLSTLEGEVQAAQDPVGLLSTLVQKLGLNGGLVCTDLGTGTCSVGSAVVTPRGAGIEATATSKVIDLQLLPIDTGMAGAIQQPSLAGTALVEAKGLSASTDAYIDGDSGAQQPSGGLTELDILGTKVVDNGRILGQSVSGSSCQPDASNLPSSLPVGEPMTFCVSTPVGDVTVVVTVGKPQTPYSGSLHRSANLTELEIRVLNGDPNGTPASAIKQLGAEGPGAIATADLGAVSSEVLGDTLVTSSQCCSTIVMEKTGMFGPGSLVFGFGLLGGGVMLRRASSRRERRERLRGRPPSR